MSQNSHKSRLLDELCLLYTFELEHNMLYLWGEIVSICRLAEVLSLKAQKRYGPQIENPQSATFDEGPQQFF